jgi:CheY-like chemotaxis protein
MRTLLADDNGKIRAALRLLLHELGEQDVVEAAETAGALAALDAGGVELVLLDWELVDGPFGSDDGSRFVEELRRKAPGCRVIAMSGRPEARQDSLRAGCDAFVSRNDPPDLLLALLQQERERLG